MDFQVLKFKFILPVLFLSSHFVIFIVGGTLRSTMLLSGLNTQEYTDNISWRYYLKDKAKYYHYKNQVDRFQY